VTGYTEERQARFLARLGLDRYSWAHIAGALLGFSATILGAYALLLWRVRRVRDPLAASYAAFCRKLARVGLARAPHEGPTVFAARCIQRRPDLAVPVARITDVYVEARYGANGSPQTVRALRREVAALKL